MINKEKFWDVLADKLGHPEWSEDSRLNSASARLQNREWVTELLDIELITRTTEEWLDSLGGLVPVAPVNDVAAALDNPFVKEQGRVRDYTHPDVGSIRMLAPPFQCSDEELPAKAAPSLGAHTNELLIEIGYDEEKISSLRASGAI